MDKPLIIIRGALVTLSLIATFTFLLGMGSGFGAVLFATGGTLTQAAALIYLPGSMLSAWNNERLPVAVCSGVALACVVLISVAGSASILSGLAGQQIEIAKERAALEALATAKQESANRLISLDRVTKAQPLLEEVEQIQAKIKALPTPSGFYQAAIRLAGSEADNLITNVIVILSLLLDIVPMLLPVSNKKGTEEQEQEQPNQTIIFVDKEPEHEKPRLSPQAQKVLAAKEAGELKKITVREVQGYLSCATSTAQETARQLRLHLQTVD